MISSEKYGIDNPKVICESIPFFARGRKLLLLLQGIAHPLISIHNEFKSWALEKNIEASITSQVMPLQWYLTHCFKDRFLNPSSSFRIIIDNLSNSSAIYDKSEGAVSEVNLVTTNVDEDIELPETHRAINIVNVTEVDDTSTSDYVILAPAIQEVAKYTNVEYKNDIRRIMSRYLTTQIDYKIKIFD